MRRQPIQLLLAALNAALDAANPHKLVPNHLPAPPPGRTLVIGGGKAAAAMACAVESHWPLHASLSGLVVTRYLHGLPLQRIKCVEASHPLPDEQGAVAARQMLDEVGQLTTSDLLLILLSGGGSSLLALPADGIKHEDLRVVTSALLASGAPIQDINTVRKHLTRFSGGRLAALSSAPTVVLIISDVVGDHLSDIASGPCAPDPSTFSDALQILETLAIQPPYSVRTHLQRGVLGEISETLKPGSSCFCHVNNRIIGSARQSLLAVADLLSRHGIEVINLGEQVGEAKVLAQSHADLLRHRLLNGNRPVALLSGGESTVTLPGAGGRGGRNTEYLLALGLALQDLNNVYAIACDTDGIDGTEDNAGAVWTPDTLSRAQTLGMDGHHFLSCHEAYVFFQALGDLVTTGPTRTNVNDLRIVLSLG